MDGGEREGNGEKDIKTRCKQSGRKKDRQSVFLRGRVEAERRRGDEAEKAPRMESASTSILVASKMRFVEGRASLFIVEAKRGAGIDCRFDDGTEGEGRRRRGRGRGAGEEEEERTSLTSS